MSILPQIPTGHSVMTIFRNMESEKYGLPDSVRGVFFTIVKIQQKIEVMNKRCGRGL